MVKDGTPICPKCGSFSMRYVSHIRMFGGYLCPDCGSTWGSDELKKKN